MKFTLKQLMVFEAVAEHSSISEAANQLAMTQSAASMSLAQLERLLGKPLFERQGKSIRMTHWGRWLRPRAKQLLGDAKQIALGFEGQHLFSGELSLGASQTSAEHLLPQLISNMGNDFPEILVQVDVENSSHVIQGVLNYHYEVGIIEGRCDDSRIRQMEWMSDHLVIVAASDHPYAAQEQVSPRQLQQARWVLREQGAGTREIFDAAIHQLVDSLDVWREYESVPILRSLTQHGPFLTCLPYFDVAAAVDSGELVILNVAELNMRRPLSFIWRAESHDSPLRECLLNEAAHLVTKRAYAQYQ